MTEKTTTGVEVLADLGDAERGSYYTIAGCGGDLMEWVDGYNRLLRQKGIGTPVRWYRTTGAAVNRYVGETHNPFQEDVTILLFPLDDLDIGVLALFKLQMRDRWFDDVVQNMRGDL